MPDGLITHVLPVASLLSSPPHHPRLLGLVCSPRAKATQLRPRLTQNTGEFTLYTFSRCFLTVRELTRGPFSAQNTRFTCSDSIPAAAPVVKETRGVTGNPAGKRERLGLGHRGSAACGGTAAER